MFIELQLHLNSPFNFCKKDLISRDGPIKIRLIATETLLRNNTLLYTFSSRLEKRNKRQLVFNSPVFYYCKIMDPFKNYSLLFR